MNMVVGGTAFDQALQACRASMAQSSNNLGCGCTLMYDAPRAGHIALACIVVKDAVYPTSTAIQNGSSTLTELVGIYHGEYTMANVAPLTRRAHNTSPGDSGADAPPNWRGSTASEAAGFHADDGRPADFRADDCLACDARFFRHDHKLDGGDELRIVALRLGGRERTVVGTALLVRVGARRHGKRAQAGALLERWFAPETDFRPLTLCNEPWCDEHPSPFWLTCKRLGLKCKCLGLSQTVCAATSSPVEHLPWCSSGVARARCHCRPSALAEPYHTYHLKEHLQPSVVSGSTP